MTKKGRQILLRIIGSILFLMLPILTSPNHSMDVVANLSNPQGQMDILLYALYLAFFYIHFEYLIPKFFFQERYVPYVGLIALSLLIIIFITNTILVFSPKRPPYSPSKMEQPNWEMEQPPPPNKIGITDKKDNEFMRPPKPPLYEPHDMEMSIWMQIARYLPMFLVVLFVSLAMRINNRWREVEQEKINAELSYLKAQINPHFLFNTLNSIYALAIEKSDETPEAITQLSSMMRYVLNDTNKDFVPLEKEIAYISNYIELQKMRFGDTLKLRYSIEGKPNGKQITPLILITFIENAFKHGVNPEENSSIFIQIEIPNGELVLTIENKKTTARQGDNTLKSGLGIENARHRLQLLYPAKHELLIADLETDYLICLKMKLV